MEQPVTFYADYYDLPWIAECEECGSSLYESQDCTVCLEADYYADLEEAA